MTDKNQEFLLELKALLRKYNACVMFAFDPYADTHGLGNSCIQIEIDGVPVKRFDYQHGFYHGDIEDPNCTHCYGVSENDRCLNCGEYIEDEEYGEDENETS